MHVQLFMRYEDIEKYNNKETVFATDLAGKSVIFKNFDTVLEVSVPVREIIKREDVETHGFVSGVFNKYHIAKSI